MSNYTKATNFATKDALTTGNPLKTLSGTELDDEFNAIQVANNTKANASNAALTGTPTAPTAAADTNTTQVATTAFVTTEAALKLDLAGGALTGALTTNSTIDGRDVAADGVLATNALPKSGGAMTGAITTNSTFDGVDIATRDGVLTSTTATANAALPKAGGTMTGDTLHGDNVKAKFGASGDLEIYHDGSSSYIKDAGTGNLYIDSSDLVIRANGAENSAKFIGNGRVELYYDAAKKIETTSTGIDVTGTVTADGLVVGNTAGGILALKTTDTVGSTGEDLGRIDFHSGDATAGSAGIMAAVISEYDSAGTSAIIKFQTGASTGSGSPTLGNRMLLGSQGDISFYDDSGNAKFFWDASAERLGIGTNSPSRTLHVYNANTTGLATFQNDGGEAVVRIQAKNSDSGILEFGDPEDGNRGRVEYDHADNHLALWANDSERMRIDSSGTVLVGTTSDVFNSSTNSGVVAYPAGSITAARSSAPAAYFNRQASDGTIVDLRKDGTTVGSILAKSGDMVLGTGEVGLRFNDGSTNIYPASATTGAAENGTINLGQSNVQFKDLHLSGQVNTGTVVTTGRVGIGTNSPTSPLHITGSGHTALTITGGTTSDAQIRFGDSSNTTIGMINYDNAINALKFVVNGSTAAIIDSSGRLLVGTATTGNTAYAATIQIASGTGGLYFRKYDATTNYPLTFRATSGANLGGVSVTETATSYNTSSDYRLKTDVQPMTGATATFKQLKPVNFEWIADGTRVDGFLAHELGEVIPAAATGSKDAMMDEEYEVSPATGDVYTAGSEAGFTEVSAAVQASPAYYDIDGVQIKAEVVAVAAVHEAFDAVAEVIHSADVEQTSELEEGQQWRETTAQVMATRSVPDMQGIDQSKVVPLLVATLQEALGTIEALTLRIEALEV